MLVLQPIQVLGQVHVAVTVSYITIIIIKPIIIKQQIIIIII